MTRDQFYRELLMLTERYEQMKPELDAALRDNELGVEGFVVVWNTAISVGGPLGVCAKGGTRISPTLSIDEVRMLAKTMAIKNAAADLPLGGAKSGMVADPNSPGFEKQYRRFVRLVKPLLTEHGGPYGGLGFDIGARPEHAIWCCDELGSTKSFTGKPRELGGTDYDKEGIAGIGVGHAAKALLGAAGLEPQRCTYAVQGLGNVGAAVVREIAGFGGKIPYISDPRLGGTYHLPDGIPEDLLPLITAQDFTGTKAYLQARDLRPTVLDDILYQTVDVLLPCAVQNVLRSDNADKVQARFVVEGANNPLTAQARTRLHTLGVTVIPDFIANPGGIIAAYIELCAAHGVGGAATAEENIVRARDRTRSTIARNVQAIVSFAVNQSIEPLAAAKYLAFTKLFGTGNNLMVL